MAGNASGTIPFLLAKSERPTSITSHDFPLRCESLQNRVEECERVLYPSEIVSPARQRIPHLNRTHRYPG